MQKYGTIQNGELLVSDEPIAGYKPIVYAGIPESFDQTAQYVIQSTPVDEGEEIFVGIEMKTLEIDEGDPDGEEILL